MPPRLRAKLPPRSRTCRIRGWWKAVRSARPAANGSPDCQTAAETLCRSKGFATGKSADITTSRKCSIRGMLHRDGSECKVETVMIKAACQ